VIPIDEDVAQEGASISHGAGIPAMDSLIYTCVRDADTFYTTDRGFEVLGGRKKPRVVFL